MAGFAKFDPRAFLESEKRTAANNQSTLATLATLAAHGSRNENQDAGNSTTTDYRQFGKYRKLELTNAKVAKAAKVSFSDTTVRLASWGEAHEERAAIVEHDGGVPREWAEALARLDPADLPVMYRRNGGYTSSTTAGGSSMTAGRAALRRLGWGPLELFGCDRHKPYARIDHAGLLWLLNGQKLLALAANAAAITTASGRQPHIPKMPE